MAAITTIPLTTTPIMALRSSRCADLMRLVMALLVYVKVLFAGVFAPAA